jgi:imidazolonepropionase-like amidohydrolase
VTHFKMKRFFFIALFGFLVSQCAAGTILFKNGIIHSVSGPTIAHGGILVEGGKIKQIGEELDAKGDQEIDLEGAHVYPGFIAASTTLGLVEIEAVRATRDFAEVGEYTPDVQSWIAVNPDSELLPVARLNGITHIAPVPTGGIVTGQSGVLALHGWTIEDMTVKAPVALQVFWPSMQLDTTPKERFKDKEKWKSLEDQAKERREKLKELDDFFSEAEAYLKQKEHAANGSKTVRIPGWEAMIPFVRGEVPLMIHADDVRQIKSAVEWAATRKYKMILAGGRDAWMVPDLLATNKIPVIYERVYNMNGGLAATPARDVDSYDIHFRAPAILHKAGVKVILGEGLSGDAAENVRNMPYTAAQAVAFGLPEEEALKAITIYPAEALGVADRLGSLGEGKEATLVVSNGNIFDIRTQVTQVWIAGNKMPMETRQTRLYEKYRNRPRPGS